MSGRTASWIIGLILIGLGILFFVGQYLHAAVWGYAFAIFLILFGVMFLIAMKRGGKGTGSYAVPGIMFLILGLVVLFQVALQYWTSWAYAWSLVAPMGLGIGLYIWGLSTDRPSLRRIGSILALIGIMLFVVLSVFFELLVAIFGVVSPGRFLVPLGLIVIGVLVLFGRRIVDLILSPDNRERRLV